MSKPKKEDVVDQTFRRKWDKAEYEAAALEREAKGGDDEQVVKPIIYEQDRGTSEARQGSLALDIMVGKHVAVEDEKKVGFYCVKCDRSAKDSVSWLDHLNSLEHQRAVGTSLRAERSTITDVRRRFTELKRKQLEELDEPEEIDFEAKLKELRQSEEERKAAKKAKKKAMKKAAKRQKLEQIGISTDPPPPESEEAQMAALMGFGNFGSTKE